MDECCDCQCTCSTMDMSESGQFHQEFEFEKPVLDVAEVELENECVMLRQMVTSQQQRIDEILVELEEERNASASAASEAMSMIVRLQREKAEVQMEFRQYKRLAEEKIVHDGEEILALEDLLCNREQVIESLTCEMSYGLKEVEAEGEKLLISQSYDNDVCEVQQDIDAHNCPSVGASPRQYWHVRGYSDESSSSIYTAIKDTSLDVSTDDLGSTRKKECVHIYVDKNPNLQKFDTSSEAEDEMSSVTKPMAFTGVGEDYKTTQNEPLYMGDLGNPDFKKLYMRLQALEADREYMRQALISLGNEKAKLLILKEIAQRRCLDMLLAKTLPVKKTSVRRSFSIFSLFKWIVSFFFWRKKACQCRCMFGMSAQNIGLLALLGKGPR
ncbi:hypothetical protein DCAR_0310270 [Daucus carota subsp. sativus]|uniref:GTD-binding domain-containing protein n=2 Tax=Daucus carota subsp. sativus TaxID=79200 RepID=A0AAF1AS80_DAUCS|nr:hypothetical protein DCAR_0310270 [Daucus carota subsp. sativus]